MGEPVIQTDGLTKRFGEITAVDDLSMEVRRGHIYGLLGPNGSGKTTTMGMLLGVLRPTSGSFRLFGSTGPHREALRRVGAVIESPAFYPTCRGGRISSTSASSPDAARQPMSTTCSKWWDWRAGATTASTPTRSG